MKKADRDLGIGKRIKALREELGMTQTELATKMGYSSKGTICNIEKGDDNMTPDRLVAFAKVLGTTPSYLAGWDSITVSSESAEENMVIEMYRNADDSTREMVKRVLAYAERFAEMHKQ